MLEENGIGANADLEYGAFGVIWIHDNSDVRPALKFLRELNILATEYPALSSVLPASAQGSRRPSGIAGCGKT